MKLKDLIKQNKEKVEWDFNQDEDYNNLPQKGDRVFHQKYGYGTIILIDGDKANVNFEKSSKRNVFLKFLKTDH